MGSLAAGPDGGERVLKGMGVLRTATVWPLFAQLRARECLRERCKRPFPDRDRHRPCGRSPPPFFHPNSRPCAKAPVARAIRADWGLAPSLFRRLLQVCGTGVPTEDQVRAYETDLMAQAIGRGWYDGASHASTYAKLQHHGAATRFLDVTRDPMVALWLQSRIQLATRLMRRYTPSTSRARKLLRPRRGPVGLPSPT